MGWKTFKEHFNIDRHEVLVHDNQLIIGSTYASKLVMFDLKTGTITPSEVSPNFLSQCYPHVLTASAEEILEQINAEDQFEASIPVFTFEDEKIIEKRCEKLGWPNVTHDGCLMYANVYFADKDKAISRAKINLKAAIELTQESILECEKGLSKQQEYLKQHTQALENLESEYPSPIEQQA